MIYDATIPFPGINFFNVHAFPNDHPGTCRSRNPPGLYLDLRRMSIEDSDEHVATYDPSAWQARQALRQTCRETRKICAIPDQELVELTLTRPARGLFVRAGDGLLRQMTPLDNPLDEDEPKAYRKIQVSCREMLVLSLENCSFNVLHEERVMLGDNEESEGWSYDPYIWSGDQARLGIEISMFAMSFSKEWRIMKYIPSEWNEDTRNPWMLISGTGAGSYYGVMCESETTGAVPKDAKTLEPNRRSTWGIRPDDGLFWDRWDDCYVERPTKQFTDGQLNDEGGIVSYMHNIRIIREEIRKANPPFAKMEKPPFSVLLKVTPEKMAVREMYIESARLET